MSERIRFSDDSFAVLGITTPSDLLLNIGAKTHKFRTGALAAAYEAAVDVSHAKSFIHRANRYLPASHLFATATKPFDPPFSTATGAGSNVYVRSGDDYRKAGQVTTGRESYPFLGDKLLSVAPYDARSNEVVVINTKLGIGMAVSGVVAVIDASNDKLSGTLGGSIQDQFEQDTLPYLREVRGIIHPLVEIDL